MKKEGVNILLVKCVHSMKNTAFKIPWESCLIIFSLVIFVLLLCGFLLVFPLLCDFIYSLNKLFYLFYECVPENLFIKIIGPEKERSGDFLSRKLNFG